MRKLNILYAVFLAASVTLVSCDDFLDVRPDSEKVADDLFSTAEGFEDAIYGVYGFMHSANLYGKEMFWGLTDIMAQDFDQNSTSAGSRALARYQYDSNDYLKNRFSAVWSTAYTNIGYANNILENLEKHKADEFPLWNIYKGEMLGVRAFLHFDLLRLFCSTDESKTGIPYSKTYTETINEFKTVGEVYGLILADLNEADSLLAEEADGIVYPHDNTNYYKFMRYRETHCNYYAVQALKARVYWMHGDMEKAAECARKVIDSGKFPLAEPTEIKDLFAGKLSDKETLWGIYSTTYNETAESYLYNYNSYNSYNPYCDVAGSTNLLSYDAVYRKDVSTTSQDYRLNWFKTSAGTVRCLKTVDYYTIEDDTEPTGWEERISGINLLHVSELYLIAAEALLDTDYDKALAYYNAETESRGLSPLPSTTTLTKDMIYNEYHKEMFGEGQVWYNMKRLNKDITSNLDSKVIPASESIYVIPIPQTEYDYRN